ncbi:ribonuclease [Sphingobium yanoikuyae]|uniref:Ribonuclease E n=2 Tax=Sphingobium yanoikuyae TaxID=13690 RepID=A0A085K8W2_SPHYA|nr:ribonuclease E/G [Sphingobium yanoikuyae]KFD29158.1 ribonuclease [Sphingobium yanoikuyae]KZC83121.1 ribonuclease [Sphingobium yanoikuyae]
MLIDARHREETRVAVVKGNRIEEFDFESAEHKQLKGNIYLAKVTRVEPSLQAAFVDYGGNRHGFLAFSEIHPDYYQIPREDREALLREERAHAEEEAALRADYDEDEDAAGDDGVEVVEATHHDDEEGAHEAEASEGESNEGGRPNRRKREKGDDAADELRRKRMALRRRYKIQDVIKRRQVLLVQVVKEERGNKGAALTTYLSLAGRYCVLMPNTSHGGGISRKISNAADRKRLKSIIAEMALPSSMGCIVRTAGLQRTKPEIKRDFDYLARLWDEIREKTLRAAAPELIHNDSDLIKRAIRDIYNKDIEEVIVEGEHGYKAAKDFMKLLMPSHARRVKQYADAVSLFQRASVEDQLAAMYNPVVQLKSGGYLVINPTEALVSIDINSGRSTREHGIEQTAVATNLEAAREIARQLRLRDMAGLVVIDFIDMEMNSNIRKVEKAMKEALKDDRARIQVGRISGFGLMEMSRQRLRTGVLEASTRQCPHCEGTGLVRTASSAGLGALRMLEEEAARGRGSVITLRASQEAAFYVLNNKRRELDEIEQRYGVRIVVLPDGEIEGARMSVEPSGPRPERVVTYAPLAEEEDDLDVIEDEEEEEEIEEEAAPERQERGERGDRGEEREGGRRRRRRRRRRGGQRDDAPGETGEDNGAEDGEEGEESADVETDAEAVIAEPAAEGEDEGGSRRRGRRGRRGGRRRREGGEAGAEAGETAGDDSVETVIEAEAAAPVEEAPVAEAAPEDAPAEEAPKTRRRPRARKAKDAAAEPAAVEATEAPAEVVAEAPAAEPVAEEAAEKPKPKRTRKKKADVEAEAAAAAEAPAAEAVAEEVAEKPKPKRTRKKKVEPVAEEAAVEAAPVVTEVATAPAEAPAAAAPASEAVTADPAAEADSDENGEPRRGWWQRTFGQ